MGTKVKLVQNLGVGYRVSFSACSRKGVSQSLLICHGVIENLLRSRHCTGC